MICFDFKGSSCQHLSDFGNVFKAFIGANFLATPYALKQSGILMGVIGIIIIAVLTDHCCLLVIKCKDFIIHKFYNDSKEIVGSEDDRLETLLTQLEANMKYSDIGKITFGRAGVILVNISLLITQVSFCIAYFIFIGNSLLRMIKPDTVIQTLPQQNTTNYTRYDNFTQSNNTLSLTDSNVSLTAYGLSVRGQTTPRLELLILAALPVLLLLSQIKQIRNLGATSLIANAMFLTGFVVITAYNCVDFHLGTNIKYFINTHSFPVFFGQMTSAFEGVGLIVSIESSMESDRHLFPFMLHSAIILLSTVFLLFGVIGYLRFGSHVAQNLNLNIEPHSGVLSISLNVVLIVGVVFTFPLQLTPVTEILEHALFVKHWSCMKTKETKKKSKTHEDVINEKLELLPPISDKIIPLPIAEQIPQHVSLWKRIILRSVLVLLMSSVAVLCKDIFIYVIAISGSVGSCMLAFVLPGLFHLKLKYSELSTLTKLKDVFIVVVGIVGGLTSLVASLKEVIQIFSNIS